MGYFIKGAKQFCKYNTDINRKCTTNVWFVAINKNENKYLKKFWKKSINSMIIINRKYFLIK